MLGAVVLVLVLLTAAGVWFSPIGDRLRADAAAQPPVSGVEDVSIADSTFSPASLAVPVGTTVTWTWVDGEAHDVVFADGPRSDVQASGSWTRTFDAPGEYAFSCTLHLFMDGRVVVTAE
ncbi:cupredoxin domain-containing protein [Salsipaludibacter albus]|uniref:cupredoxin domain-containing protein n=1 Tax=Salsipaludibacter albus TaxID=2849650 RepID=UPI001EE4A1DC